MDKEETGQSVLRVVLFDAGKILFIIRSSIFIFQKTHYNKLR